MKSSKNITLGLDVSTSITGASIMSNQVILETCIWDMRNKKKFPTIYEKARFIKNKILELGSSYHISNVVIEKPFTFFSSGGSSAKTMSVLQRFNGMISWVCYDFFQFEPRHITSQEARKLVGISVKRGENSKEKVLEFVLDKYPKISVQYTKHGNPKAGTYDMCDSIVTAIAGEELVNKNANT